MKEERKLPVKISKTFTLDLDDIFKYTLDTFGLRQAELYESELYVRCHGIEQFLLYQGCKNRQDI